MNRIVCPLVASAAILCSVLAAPCAAQLSFNVSSSGITNADTAFQIASNAWSSEFKDSILINLDISFSSLGGLTLANTSSANQLSTFSSFRSAISSDLSSTDDQTYADGLPTGSAFSVYINRTAEASGFENEVPYVDSDGGLNNSSVRLTTANAKALGLRDSNDALLDAAIIFNNNFAWDFDRVDGIAPGTIDFIGVAMHEIGHALGFESGVDVLDANGDGLSSDNEFDFVSSIDFLRFSADSEAAGADLDWTADMRDKYLSIDGGASALISGSAHWSTGFEYGDGEQASHWKDTALLGLMVPTTSSGLIPPLSSTDLAVFDVIGYDRFLTVPEPTGTALLAGLLLWATSRRRRA